MAKSERICSVEGCGKFMHARTYCPGHYYRWEKGIPISETPLSKVSHGHSRRGAKTKTYRTWKAMLTRARPGGPEHKNYAARGISVDPAWRDYATFLADMGEAPEGMTLDRIDNDAGYSAANCRWADMTTQRRNQRRVSWVKLNGKTMTMQDAADQLGVSHSTIWQDKRRRGGTHQEALDRVAQRVAAKV